MFVACAYRYVRTVLSQMCEFLCFLVAWVFTSEHSKFKSSFLRLMTRVLPLLPRQQQAVPLAGGFNEESIGL